MNVLRELNIQASLRGVVIRQEIAGAVAKVFPTGLCEGKGGRGVVLLSESFFFCRIFKKKIGEIISMRAHTRRGQIRSSHPYYLKYTAVDRIGQIYP